MLESHLDSLTHRAKLTPAETAVLEGLMSRIRNTLGLGRSFQVSSENVVWFFIRCQRWLGIEGPEVALLEKLTAAYGITPEMISKDLQTPNRCLRCGDLLSESQMATLHCCLTCRDA